MTINDNTIQTESFLYGMLCIGEGVFEFCRESDFLSRSQVDDIISFLACKWLYDVIDCIMQTARLPCALFAFVAYVFVAFVVLCVRFL